MTDLCFIDCETTGTDPRRHMVWEIAFIVDDKEYSWILALENDEVGAAEPMALHIGEYYRRVSDALDRQQERGINRFLDLEEKTVLYSQDRSYLADLMATLIGNSHLVGAVPSFDARFVGDFMFQYHRPPSWHYHLIDVEALAAGKLGLQPPWKSKDLYRALGINPEAFAEHTALGDARMAKAVYEAVFDLPPSYPGAILEETYRTPQAQIH